MEGIKIEVGEVRENNKGTKMKIIRCNGNDDIDVEFLDDFHYIKRNNTYNNFVRGQIKNPYDKTLYGIGYIGHGRYKPSINKQNTPAYNQWVSMLERCYCEKRRHRTKAYVKCEVCKEWLNFQNFAEWYYENYYQIDDDIMQIDKDILEKGNKIYSPDTCVFVNNKINSIFTKHDGIRGEYPIGVFKRENGKFGASVSINGKQHKLGIFNTVEDAFNSYKIAKENEIKRIADYYKEQIPYKLYKAMYEYKVEITD